MSFFHTISIILNELEKQAAFEKKVPTQNQIKQSKYINPTAQAKPKVFKTRNLPLNDLVQRELWGSLNFENLQNEINQSIHWNCEKQPKRSEIGALILSLPTDVVNKKESRSSQLMPETIIQPKSSKRKQEKFLSKICTFNLLRF